MYFIPCLLKFVLALVKCVQLLHLIHSDEVTRTCPWLLRTIFMFLALALASLGLVSNPSLLMSQSSTELLFNARYEHVGIGLEYDSQNECSFYLMKNSSCYKSCDLNILDF